MSDTTGLPSPDLLSGGMFLGGATRELGGERIPVLDPATGQRVGEIAEAGEGGVDQAVAAAEEAFRAWRAVPAAERGAILQRAADAVAERIDDLVGVLTAEQGKPLRESRLELGRFVETLEHYAGLSRNLRGTSVPDLDVDTRGIVLARPLGVVAAIVPWNFPTTLLGNKLGPALVAGNTVVAKPDETTPFTTLRIAEIMHSAGLPDGVFNVITGTGEVTGAALTRHPGVRKIGFTGSTPVGKLVMATAADTLKRVTLELGGSDPLLIDADADVDAAISAASMGRFFNCGQACLAVKRVYVVGDRAEEVADRIASKAARLTLGDGRAQGTQIGPLHSDEGRNTIGAQLADAVSSGGKVLAGGDRPEGDEYAAGFFHQPTVVWEPGHDSRVATEETFGPLLPVWRVADLDEAIERANASPFGLGSSVWTNDLRAAMHAAERLDAGYTWINSRTKVYDELPFGGLKQSGYGKEHGIEALRYYTEEKSVVIRD